jgi:hypothetical protein
MQLTFKGYDVRELFDPVQTHAVYGLYPSEVARVKQELKENLKATRFRVVTNSMGGKILCFKIKSK